MGTILFSHPACGSHDMGAGHPEQPDRLRAIATALSGPAFAGLDRREAPAATRDRLLLAHPEHHVDAILGAVPAKGLTWIDGDTALSPGTGEAALRAVGAVVAAVDAVVKGPAHNAFCAVRPPGHHAEAERAMGFCFFNSIAIGAIHAQAMHNLRRVAVIDFDVHHGNGTQDIFWAREGLFYASLHQYPLYPGTGRPDEKGAAANILNIPLPPGADGAAMRFAVERSLLPALDRFAPELVMISAGFDAHADDPLANLEFADEDYAWLTDRLCDIARRHAGGRLVSALEGGYDLEALGRSVAAHVSSLMRAA